MMPGMESIALFGVIAGMLAAPWFNGRVEGLEAAVWGKGKVFGFTAVSATAAIVACAAGGWPQAVAQWHPHQWAWGTEAAWGAGSLVAWALSMLGVVTIWVRLWMCPTRYSHRNGVAERYFHHVLSTVEEGSEEELRRMTKGVSRDVPDIVAWAKDEERYAQEASDGGKRLDERWKAAHYGRLIVDLMGDRRWAGEITRQGGRLARRTLGEALRQRATHIGLAKMLASVTEAAVEQEGSFLEYEASALSGSTLLGVQKPSSRTLWQHAPVLALPYDDGRWVDPGKNPWLGWRSREWERWMQVACTLTGTWARTKEPGQSRVMHSIASGLSKAALQDWREQEEGRGNRLGRLDERCGRLMQVVRAAKGATEAHAVAFTEALREEAVDIAHEALSQREEEEGDREWLERHNIWRKLTWGQGLLGEGPERCHGKLAEAVCGRLRMEMAGFLEQGDHWPGPPSMIGVLIWLRGAQMHWKYEATAGAKAERELLEWVWESVQKSFRTLERDDTRTARRMLGKGVQMEVKPEGRCELRIQGSSMQEGVEWTLQ